MNIILDARQTATKLKEYDDLYGVERERYASFYYEKHQIMQVDFEYLMRCIQASGFDAAEYLAESREYIWKGDEEWQKAEWERYLQTEEGKRIFASLLEKDAGCKSYKPNGAAGRE